MRKLVTLSMAIAAAASLSACKPAAEAPTETTEVADETTPEAATPAAVTAEPAKAADAVATPDATKATESTDADTPHTGTEKVAPGAN
jgi:hypothetical protein